MIGTTYLVDGIFAEYLGFNSVLLQNVFKHDKGVLITDSFPFWEAA